MEQIRVVKNGGMPENWYAFYVWQRTGCYVDEALRKMGIKYSEHKRYMKDNRKLEELSKEELEKLYSKCSMKEIIILYHSYYNKVVKILKSKGIKVKNCSEVFSDKVDKNEIKREVAKVEKLISSGLNVREACIEIGTTKNRFYYWQRKLRELEG